MNHGTPPPPAETGGFSAGQKVGTGRFTLVRFLGRGGMGLVWLAEDSRLHQQVALKFLPVQIFADPDALEDMRHETVRSIKLSHPHIIRIHDLHEYPDELFIAMEFVDGPTVLTLKCNATQGLLSWEKLRPLLSQLCDALKYAHGEQVIHRDLKPANMMLDSRGRLRLADFGIAAVVSEPRSRVSLKHLKSGTMMYMSPEQMNGKKPQPTDDIYALGATLYELLTSRPPFYTGDIGHQVQNNRPTPMEERLAEFGLSNEIPPAVSAMVMACLAKDRALRPQSAGAVAEWIGLEVSRPATGELAESVGISAAEETSPGENDIVVPSRPGWFKWPAIGVTFVVAGTITGLVWHHQQESNTSPANGKRFGQLKANATAPASATSGFPREGRRWTNSLGQIFMPVPGTKLLFCVWETRVQDYRAFVQVTERMWPKPKFEQGPTHPAVNVSRDDAKAFCAWLTDTQVKAGELSRGQSYRLPTDEEWSQVVGLKNELGNTPEQKNGKTPDIYPWGTQWPPPPGAGNFDPGLKLDNYQFTSPVGSFSANEFGLFDLSGNVWEWCEDPYDGKQKGGVLRGGSWGDGLLVNFNSSRRYNFRPGDRNDYVGFRCVLVGGAAR